MKKIFLFLAFFAFASAEEGTVKVVYDLTTPDVEAFQKKVLSGIVANKTYYQGKLQELEVSVVIHGGAYRFFLKDLQKSEYKDDKKLGEVFMDLKKRIATMSDTYDVEFLICKSGMKSHNIKDEDIAGFVKMVPNSTIGLINKQNEGFAYIPINN